MNDAPVVEYDCAVVLGAKVMDDGTPSPALARRVEHAARLVRAGKAAHLLMSGGPVNHPIPEAHVMRDLAVAAGVPAERVLVETQSFNTIGNARFCAPVIAAHGWKRLVLVTDSYHLPRSRLIFRRFGINADASGAKPDRMRPEWVWAHVREVFAMMKTLWRLSRMR